LLNLVKKFRSDGLNVTGIRIFVVEVDTTSRQNETPL